MHHAIYLLAANLSPVAQPAGPSKNVLLIIAGGIWLLGGNIVVACHYHRRGKSPWTGFKTRAFPFKDFDSTEWLVLLLLFISAAIIATSAMA